MRRAILLFAFFSILWSCSSDAKFVNNNPSEADTLIFYDFSKSSGKFERIIFKGSHFQRYSGSFYKDGHNIWVYPWYGKAYNGTGFYTTDSANINLIMRRNIWGGVNELEMDDHNSYMKL